MLQKLCISDKCCSFELSIHQIILKKNIVHKYFVQLYTINVSWAADQHIRMISEGSCDTEDWSNDAENSALITGINYFIKYIQTENSYFKL